MASTSARKRSTSLQRPRSHTTAASQVVRAQLASSVLGNERTVWVYTPPGYSTDAGPTNALLLFDGATYLHQIQAPAMIERLIAAGQIAPTLLVLVDSIDETTRDRELPCYAPMVQFLTDELLPWAHAHWHLSRAPEHTSIGGSSYGGLAASFAAFTRPDVFGRVLAQSGSFWWRPHDDPEYEWLTRQFVDSPRLPLQFYLSIGRREARARVRPNQLIATRHLRDVLRAKGYPVHYTETDGEHHYRAWRANFADALIALLAEQPSDKA